MNPTADSNHHDFPSDATLIADLAEPRVAADDCLPHAAMGLGSMRAVGTSPQPTLVYRVIIQKQMSAWCVFRMDADGGFVGETWHPDRDDALRSACKEFGLVPQQFQPVAEAPDESR